VYISWDINCTSFNNNTFKSTDLKIVHIVK